MKPAKARKPAAKPAAKPVAKPVAKPAAKPVAKPVAKPAAKPAAQLGDAMQQDQHAQGDAQDEFAEVLLAGSVHGDPHWKEGRDLRRPRRVGPARAGAGAG